MKLPLILLCGQAGAGKDTVGQMIAKRHGFKTMGQADAIKEMARAPFSLTQDQLYGPSESRNAVVPHLNTPTIANALMWIGSDFRNGTPQDARFAAMREKLLQLSPGGAVVTLNRMLSDFLNGCAKKAEDGTLTTRWILQQLGTEVGRAYDQLIWTRATVAAAQKAIWDGAPGVVITDGRFRSEVLTVKDAGGVAVRIDSDSTLSGATHASEAELASIPDHFFEAILKNKKHQGLEGLETLVERTFNWILEPATIETHEAVLEDFWPNNDSVSE